MEQEDGVPAEVLVAHVVMGHRRRASLPVNLQWWGYRRRHFQLGYCRSITVPVQYKLGLCFPLTFRCG